jgi:hypothetical protein
MRSSTGQQRPHLAQFVFIGLGEPLQPLLLGLEHVAYLSRNVDELTRQYLHDTYEVGASVRTMCIYQTRAGAAMRAAPWPWLAAAHLIALGIRLLEPCAEGCSHEPVELLGRDILHVLSRLLDKELLLMCRNAHRRLGHHVRIQHHLLENSPPPCQLGRQPGGARLCPGQL